MWANRRVGAIIAAAGAGTRFGAPKQWLQLGGQTLLRHTASLLAHAGVIDELVVAVPAGSVAFAQFEVRELPVACSIVAGGDSRGESVLRAFERLSPCDIVVVHDCARPFVTAELLRSVVASALEHGAAIPALPPADTVKTIGNGRIGKTLTRRELVLVQTPQAFQHAILDRAFEHADSNVGAATDESTLVENINQAVVVVPGDPANFKITTPEDWLRARARIEAEAPKVAIGHGYDAHPFKAGRKLVLGGVTFEGDGLDGHSDADVCSHALANALLGAARLGDIGQHFPDTDPQFKDLSSLELLGAVARQIRDAGFDVANCDITVVAKRPRLRDRVADMQRNVATALGVSITKVSVKGCSGNGLGFAGRGEGICAHANALLSFRGSP